MPPQAVQLAIFLIQQLIAHEPEIAAEIKALLTKSDPTDDEWKALHNKVIAKGYRDYVPASVLPQVAAPGPAVTPATPVTPVTARSQSIPPAAAPESTIPAVVPITVLTAASQSDSEDNFDPKVTAAALALSTPKILNSDAAVRSQAIGAATPAKAGDGTPVKVGPAPAPAVPAANPANPS